MQGMNLSSTPEPRTLPEQTAHRLSSYRVKDMPTYTAWSQAILLAENYQKSSRRPQITRCFFFMPTLDITGFLTPVKQPEAQSSAV